MKTNIIESRLVFAQKLKHLVEMSGKTQKEIAQNLGVSTATLSEWVNGKKFPKIDKFELIAKQFGVSKSDLVENDDTEENCKANNRGVFSDNLRLYMAKTNKSRKEISEAIGVSYFTFSDWCKGKKYPRIEKLEMLAKYFGITVSELVDEKQGKSIRKKTLQTDKDDVLDIILRLHTDVEFLKLVEKLCELDEEKLKSLKNFLIAFNK